jgi:hypothetical protein
MPEISKTDYGGKDIDVEISETGDGYIEFQDLIIHMGSLLINFW